MVDPSLCFSCRSSSRLWSSSSSSQGRIHRLVNQPSVPPIIGKGRLDTHSRCGGGGGCSLYRQSSVSLSRCNTASSCNENDRDYGGGAIETNNNTSINEFTISSQYTTTTTDTFERTPVPPLRATATGDSKNNNNNNSRSKTEDYRTDKEDNRPFQQRTNGPRPARILNHSSRYLYRHSQDSSDHYNHKYDNDPLQFLIHEAGYKHEQVLDMQQIFPPLKKSSSSQQHLHVTRHLYPKLQFLKYTLFRRPTTTNTSSSMNNSKNEIDNDTTTDDSYYFNIAIVFHHSIAYSCRVLKRESFCHRHGH